MVVIVRHPSSICQSYLKIFFSEIPWPIKAKFHVKPPWEVGMKVNINDPGHKMATMPMYGKNLLQNQKYDDLETWHETSLI